MQFTKRLFLSLLAFSTLCSSQPARANDFFDMNNNGVPDFVDPTTPTYWAMQSCNNNFSGNSNGSGGGGGPMKPGHWILVGGIAVLVITPFLALACDDYGVGGTFVYHEDESGFVEFFRYVGHMGKEYSAAVWCGTKSLARGLGDWVRPKKKVDEATVTKDDDDAINDPSLANDEEATIKNQ